MKQIPNAPQRISQIPKGIYFVEKPPLPHSKVFYILLKKQKDPLSNSIL